MGLASCSSFTKDKSGAEIRKEGYNALLKTVKPGMYRRQLYAVLPPHGKPVARPPDLFAFVSVPVYGAHQETHVLDDECYVTVHYQLKDGKEYTRPTRGTRGPTRSGTKANTPITPDSIDQLLEEATLLARHEMPSRENADDIIISVSEVHISTASPRIVEMPTMTGFPTQEHGVKFGRPIEPNKLDFPFLEVRGPSIPGKGRSVSLNHPVP
jgi:hypothetical protein